MGGDEFVLVLPGFPEDLLDSLRTRLSGAVAELGRTMCHEDALGISVGEANYPLDGTDAEKLLAEADRRMYAVKQAHRQYAERVWPSSCELVLVQ
jgi:diguanylate cyclase (GGDEF)-like protein